MKRAKAVYLCLASLVWSGLLQFGLFSFVFSQVCFCLVGLGKVFCKMTKVDSLVWWSQVWFSELESGMMGFYLVWCG